MSPPPDVPLRPVDSPPAAAAVPPVPPPENLGQARPTAGGPHEPLGWVRLAALWAFYLSLMLLGLGSERALTRHEVFAAQPAREMLAYGDTSAKWWLIQHFAEEPRYEKPPAMSWLIAASVRVFGEREWAVRLPAVLAGGAVVWLVAWMSSRLHGPTAGVTAGAMQATFFYMVMQARLAEVDIVLAAAVFGALACAAAAWVPGVARGDSAGRGRLGWGFALLTGLSMALKGPIGPMLVFAGLAGFAGARFLAARGADTATHQPLAAGWAVLAWGFHPLRLGAMLAVAAAWPLAAVAADPAILTFWQKQLIARVTTGAHIGTTGGSTEPWWFYTWNVPMLLLPWVLVAPWAWAEVRRRGAAVCGADWALGVLLAGTVALSLLADKHKHYVIPVLPAVTPMLAAGLLRLLHERHTAQRRSYLVEVVLWLVASAAGVVAVWLAVPEPLRAGVLVAVVGLVVGAAATRMMEWRRRLRGHLLALFATAWWVIAAVNVLVTPSAERFWVFRDFAASARAHLRPGARVEMVGLGMHPVAFYLPLPLGRVDRPGETWFPGVGRWLVMSAAGLQRWGPVWAERGVELEVVVEGLPMRGGGGREDERLVLVRTRAKSP